MYHPASWMPHGHCFQWAPGVLWPWVVGDIGTALVYAVIPALLVALWRARPDVLPAWAAASFGCFILACGIGHALGAYVLWHPVYSLFAAVKVVTFAASVPAVVGLVAALRNARGVVTPAALERYADAMRARGDDEGAAAAEDLFARVLGRLDTAEAMLSGGSDAAS